MNKKQIIILVAIITLVISVIGLAVLINNNNANKNVSSTDTINDIKNRKYYVEKGIESPAELAKLAVESFANQDKSESVASRLARLKKYFTNDSPVYEYGLDNIDANTVKSSIKVSSITSCEEQEGGDLCLLVMAKINYTYSDNSVGSSDLTYWITVLNTDGKYKAYDIGVWQ